MAKSKIDLLREEAKELASDLKNDDEVFTYKWALYDGGNKKGMIAFNASSATLSPERFINQIAQLDASISAKFIGIFKKEA